MKFQPFMIGHVVLLLATSSATLAASDAQKPTAAEVFVTAPSPGAIAKRCL